MSVLRFKFDKLVRDKVPDLLGRQGVKLNYEILSRTDRIPALKRKLTEEVDELISAQSKVEVLTEISDIFEVVDSLYHQFGAKRENYSQSSKKINFKGFLYEKLLKVSLSNLSDENYELYFVELSTVLYDIARSINITFEEISDSRKKKNDKYGTFLVGIFAHYAEINSNNKKLTKYFSGQPEKYPIIS